MKIPFNKPYFTGKEIENIADAFAAGKICGNGKYTKLCQEFFKKHSGFRHALLTTSCTDALEMSALLTDLKPGDEVIIPSYTFVSTANAFALRGAKIRFAESHADQPNIDESKIEELITPKTRAIVPVHYAGVACKMDTILAIAKKHNLLVAEDSAQGIASFFVDAEGKRHPLGGIGDFASFSFHETKNIVSGEGGMLVVNNPDYVMRSEIIWEKGTNRSAFFRGETDKYGWVAVGSSFLPSEMIAAFLYAQLENMDRIQEKRIAIWEQYYRELAPLQDKGCLRVPSIPPYATNNAHMFYILSNTLKEGTGLIDHLKKHEVSAVFHYPSLHQSKYYQDKHDGRHLPNSDRFADTLVRLPLYYELTDQEVGFICKEIKKYFGD
jgi:dTDP-4-amino-4,6-dideoxygalactose transaminase